MLILNVDLPPSEAWDLVDVLVSNINHIIQDNVPRHVQDLYR